MDFSAASATGADYNKYRPRVAIGHATAVSDRRLAARIHRGGNDAVTVVGGLLRRDHRGLPTAMQALWPPKPKELLIAQSTLASWGTLGV